MYIKKMIIAGVLFVILLIVLISAAFLTQKGGEDVKFKIYFGNTKMGSSEDCSKVFPVFRSIPKKNFSYSSVLDELIKGPNKQELEEGYFSSINPDTKVRMTFQGYLGSIIQADFDENLGKGVAGSCRVIAIRAQITKTLSQFAPDREVVISILNQTEGILQP